MHRYHTWLLLVCGMLVLTGPTRAKITIADLPLKSALRSELIFVAKVEYLDDADPEKPRMMLRLNENLKGKAPFEKLPVHLAATSEDGKKYKHTDILVNRVKKDLPLVFFVHKKNDWYIAFVYSNGTWFQLHGVENGQKSIVWSHLNCEPNLRKTFKGTTAELKQTIVDALDEKKKKEPPPIDENEKPGFGPEAKK